MFAPVGEVAGLGGPAGLRVIAALGGVRALRYVGGITVSELGARGIELVCLFGESGVR